MLGPCRRRSRAAPPLRKEPDLDLLRLLLDQGLPKPDRSAGRVEVPREYPKLRSQRSPVPVKHCPAASAAGQLAAREGWF